MPRVGATGKFPEGKLNDSDEGELSIAITVEKGTILVVFGTATTWIGMNPDLADEIGHKLIERAKEAREQLNKGVSLSNRRFVP